TRRLPIPVVFTNHTSGFLQRMERGLAAQQRVARWLDHVSEVLAPSEELAAATRRLNIDSPVQYIPNGVDVARFQPGPSSLRQSLNIGPEEVVVLLARR